MKFIDLFSGVGGFTRGMELAGHECVGHCEIDKYAEASYRSMHTITDEQRDYLQTLTLQQRQVEILKEEYLNGEWYAADITGVRPDDVPEAECYCFGFPCQAFSIAGNRRGFEDARGTLFFEVMRIVKERKPQILFAENVAGLLNHRGGVTFDVIINTMAELGYLVEWQVLNSRYFGVPQNRERVFIVGHLGDRRGREVFPIAADDTKADELQGHDNNMIAGTLARGNRVSTGCGCYPIINREGLTALKVNGYHKEVSEAISAGYKSEIKKIEIAHTIGARDYKGICNQAINAVMYENKSEERN